MRVFLLPLDETRDADWCHGWIELLDDAERVRADKYHRAADRTRYVAGHALLRAVLGSATGQMSRSLRFRRLQHGKPELASSGPHFNLSHTEGLIACAVHDAPVGCDVEPADRRVESGVHRMMAAAELCWLNGRPCGPARDADFIKLWVVKEAFVKCLGLGLLLDPACYAFDITQEQIDLVQPPPGLEGGPWRVTLIDAGPRHVGAVAASGEGNLRPAVQWVSPSMVAGFAVTK